MHSHVDPAFRVGTGGPAALRHVRRAHGPLRLHRDLRAGPSDGRRRPASAATCSTWSGELGPTVVALPGRQLRLRLPLGGRRRPAGRAAPPARPRLEGDRDQRVRASTSSRPWCRHGRDGADHGGQSRHPRGAGSRGPAGVLQPPGGHGALGPAARARRQGAARHQGLVPGQRAGRPVAGRPQDRRRVRPPRRRDRPGDAHGRPAASSWSPAAAPTARMPTFAAWEATVLEHCYDLVDYVSLHTYYDPLPSDLPTFLASSVDLDRMIDAVVATADHVGARLKSRRRLQPLGRRVERLVPVPLPRPGRAATRRRARA